MAWSHRKEVITEINGVEVDLSMKLDERGKAYFDHQKGFDEPDDASAISVSEEKCSLLRRGRSRHHSDHKEVRSPEEESPPVSAATRAGSNPQLTELVERVVETNRVLVLELSEAELAKYNLQRGCNEMVFSVTTQFQGTSRCQCNVFVWDQQDKIVISDIDGTITRSDVRGMLLPLIGFGDWAQGEVASLFSKISSNGYKVVYLSARSISQASETKAYLQSLRLAVRRPDGDNMIMRIFQSRKSQPSSRASPPQPRVCSEILQERSDRPTARNIQDKLSQHPEGSVREQPVLCRVWKQANRRDGLPSKQSVFILLSQH